MGLVQFYECTQMTTLGNFWILGLTGQSNAKQSYNDGVVEVLGIYSSFHMAQLQMGLSSPFVVGQAKNVEVSLHNTFFNKVTF